MGEKSTPYQHSLWKQELNFSSAKQNVQMYLIRQLSYAPLQSPRVQGSKTDWSMPPERGQQCRQNPTSHLFLFCCKMSRPPEQLEAEMPILPKSLAPLTDWWSDTKAPKDQQNINRLPQLRVHHLALLRVLTGPTGGLGCTGPVTFPSPRFTLSQGIL